jgi:hypothetical protein
MECRAHRYLSLGSSILNPGDTILVNPLDVLVGVALAFNL